MAKELHSVQPTTSNQQQKPRNKFLALSISSIALISLLFVSSLVQQPSPRRQSTVKTIKTGCAQVSHPSSPILVDINGTWSVTHSDTDLIKGWTWHPGPNSDSMRFNKYYTTWQRIDPPSLHHEVSVVKRLPPPLPGYPQIAPGTLSSVLQSDNTSLVFYGSSHTRALLFAMMRLEYGMDLFGELPRNITYMPSGTKHMEKACNPRADPIKWSFFGVDMEKCGQPARRIIQELSPNVAFGFKAFLHTPDADAHFLEFLNQKGLRHPEIIVMDAGLWGPRGKKRGGSAQTFMTPTQEWDYYMEWIHISFPQSHIVLVNEGNATILHRFQALAQNTSSPQQHVTILRKDALLQNKPPDMPCEHGCAGLVLNTLAIILIEWLQQRQSMMAHC